MKDISFTLPASRTGLRQKIAVPFVESQLIKKLLRHRERRFFLTKHERFNQFRKEKDLLLFYTPETLN
jgi:hypothetical protein